MAELSESTSETAKSSSETVATKVQPLETALSPQERFSEYLQSRGLRQTSQRKFLIEQVFSQHEHFDAEELIERLPRRGEDNYVSTATVYRTLRECVDAGLLNSFQLDGRTVYDHDYGYPEHDHLYCTRCRKLLEFQSDELVAIRDQMAALHGFRVESHKMIINGVCRECSRRRRKKRKQDLV
ncbi:Fur family transcriptional regulator [Rhodopirellula sp. JC639]|uniref:Fur family transcriptional regulator n=1 Tax=Stieleria mannarensis TaxID=2755585 RepID=UPI001602B1E8|nr:Fur family transcriptional regulator [Rhodopirellula sp. JC639]